MKFFVCLSLLALCAAVGAEETLAQSSNLIQDIVLMLEQAARSTSYSSLLTLNVTNVIVLAFLAFIGLGYFGFIDVGLGLGRSFGGSSFDLSAVKDTVASVAPLVYQAFEYYNNLQDDQKS